MNPKSFIRIYLPSIFFFVLLVIASCNSKEDSTKQASESSDSFFQEPSSKRDIFLDSVVRGNWVFRTMRYYHMKDRNNIGFSSGKSYSLNYADKNIRIGFNADHTLYYDSIKVGKWRFQNHQIIFLNDSKHYTEFPLSFNQEYNITIVGNVLTFKRLYTSEEMVREIVLISAGRR